MGVLGWRGGDGVGDINFIFLCFEIKSEIFRFLNISGIVKSLLHLLSNHYAGGERGSMNGMC